MSPSTFTRRWRRLSTARMLGASVGVAVAATILALAIALGVGSSKTGGRPPGFVYRHGNRLYLDGRSYRFAGVNIPWANDRLADGCGSSASTKTLNRTLDRVGRSANAVRVWLFQSQATNAGHRDWTAFDQTLRAIAHHGLRVVVTLGDEQGACGDPGGFKDISWYRRGYADTVSPGFPQSYRDYVHDVVSRYHDHGEILAWQLMNEASVVNPALSCTDEAAAARALRAWTDDVAGMIRSIDPYHLISLGTGLEGTCGSAVTNNSAHNDYAHVHASPNIDLCEYHDFNLPAEPLPGPERQEMGACATLDRPFFVGELGISSIDPRRSAELSAKLAAQFGYGKEPAQGVLIWEVGSPKVGMCDEFCTRPSDPELDLLRNYRRDG